MVWTPKQFATRHNKDLEKNPGKAKQAAKVSNAILKEETAKGVPESKAAGKAIRIANWQAKRKGK